jgi:hypothetical protein
LQNQAGLGAGPTPGHRKSWALFFRVGGLACTESSRGWTLDLIRAAGILELRILSWRDSLRIIQAGLDTCLSHTTQNLGNGARIFEMEGLSCEESGQAARAGPRQGCRNVEPRIFFFFEIRDSLAKNPGQGCAREDHAQGSRKVELRIFFLSRRNSLAKDRAGSWCAVSHAGAARGLGLRIFELEDSLTEYSGRAGH